MGYEETASEDTDLGMSVTYERDGAWAARADTRVGGRLSLVWRGKGNAAAFSAFLDSLGGTASIVDLALSADAPEVDVSLDDLASRLRGGRMHWHARVGDREFGLWADLEVRSMSDAPEIGLAMDQSTLAEDENFGRALLELLVATAEPPPDCFEARALLDAVVEKLVVRVEDPPAP